MSDTIEFRGACVSSKKITSRKSGETFVINSFIVEGKDGLEVLELIGKESVSDKDMSSLDALVTGIVSFEQSVYQRKPSLKYVSFKPE